MLQRKEMAGVDRGRGASLEQEEVAEVPSDPEQGLKCMMEAAGARPAGGRGK